TPIPGADAFSGNTLNVLGGGHSAGGVENFETMNFTLPANVANGDTLLDAGGGAVVLGDGVTGSGKATTVNLYVAGPLTRFAEGDTVNLIATTGSVSGDLANTSARAQAGLLVYDFTVGTTANTLFATLDLATGTPTPSAVADSAKALAEVNLGSVSLVNQGQDAVFTGIDILGGDGAGPLDAVAIDQRRRKTFVVIDADDSRYKTGSHVDVKGVKALAGLNAEIGNVSFGAFVEGGHGNYDSRNDFSGRRVKADGESDYAGAGVLARWDGNGGLWLEGSLRAGRTKTDFDSRDVLPGSRTRYHSRSDYVSGHGGIGYAFAPNPSDTLKLYSKILWTRLSNDAVTVHGDRVKFYSVDSLRWRNGFRWQRTAGEFRPYAGLAWEHEFDGKAKATVAGRKIDRPDLDGDTGIAEAGFRYTKAGSPFTIDLNLRGYAGQRQGWGGGVKMEYRF
ncbi:MAG: autotransporter domain-containing protein, partial [Candidatus Accumulibacter sp.]|nr:autotransporter domain-containing protein [Accumulibacter sp.]